MLPDGREMITTTTVTLDEDGQATEEVVTEIVESEEVEVEEYEEEEGDETVDRELSETEVNKDEAIPSHVSNVMCFIIISRHWACNEAIWHLLRSTYSISPESTSLLCLLCTVLCISAVVITYCNFFYYRKKF